MPLPTNRQPPGLLAFFGVKNLGKNPAYAMDQYNAVIDLLDWNLADPLISVDIVNAAFNAPAGGNFTAPGGGPPGPFIVPDGELWILTELSITSAQMGAGQTLTGCPAIASGGPNSAPYLLGPTNAASIGGTNLSLGAASYRPLRVFCKAGTQIGFYCTTLVAGPVSCQAQARVAKIRPI